ncbi:hypothetical protein CA85_50320 [Allorhodopirellula solitaria]|uniref:Uncharacterized protein n=1 Tax=Allorhodopirellula solitaria TaxID=2527987 RepID=A0A5C5WR13_9BACT|nr:hypothetical protein CA85_50320 [Allorhodopirellula solitaria]
MGNRAINAKNRIAKIPILVEYHLKIRWKYNNQQRGEENGPGIHLVALGLISTVAVWVVDPLDRLGRECHSPTYYTLTCRFKQIA